MNVLIQTGTILLSIVQSMVFNKKKVQPIKSTPSIIIEEEDTTKPDLIRLLGNKYTSLELISKGSYGQVYKAIDIQTDNIVAIKTFKYVSSEYYAFHPSTLRESSLLLHIQHLYKEQGIPNHIISIQDIIWSTDMKDISIVYPFMAQDLFSLINDLPHKLSMTQVQYLSKQLLLAVHQCHRYQICHRDIKPENILLNHKVTKYELENNITNIHLFLCDFGHSRMIDPLPRYIYTNAISTLCYRAPELLLHHDEYDLSIDMWSVGCVMMELLTGKAVFDGNNAKAVIKAIKKLLGPCENMSNEWKDSHNTAPKSLQDPLKIQENLKLLLLQAGYTDNQKTNEIVHLLHGLLCVEAKNRMRIVPALQHPFFQSI